MIPHLFYPYIRQGYVQFATQRRAVTVVAMRLLNNETLKLEEFFGSDIPDYAILSHTWGKEEISLQDLQMSQAELERNEGYSKLRGCCVRAAKDGYKYVWIDTCCIDKTSSAELSEAINSMFQWYSKSDICYAYLVDVPTVEETPHHWTGPQMLPSTFSSSRWFTRGWTLQELIAPRYVEFYAADWTEIGTKSSLREELSRITSINICVLDGEDPAICNVAERLSWAASRETSRLEDAAYCLLGIFQVHLPLLYGEGRNALVRLQEQILKTTEDYTLLARSSFELRGLLNRRRSSNTTSGALARDLVEFKIFGGTWGYSDLELDRDENTERVLRKRSKNNRADITPTLTAKGLQICLPLLRVTDFEYLAYLYCKIKSTGELLCMPLTPTNLEANRFQRRHPRLEEPGDHQLLAANSLKLFRLVTMFIQQEDLHAYQEGTWRRQIHQEFEDYIFEVYGTTVSDDCVVHTSWGNTTMHLPWVTEIIQPRRFSISARWAASFSLGSDNNFIVKFGIESGKLWCEVLLEPQRAPGLFGEDNWAEEAHATAIPDIIMDRAIKKLRSNLGVVFVSIRKASSRLLVSVRIKGFKAARSSGHSAIEHPNQVSQKLLVHQSG